MPRTEEQNQRLKEERRRTLLEASRQVFARKGFAASTMADLAAAAGISHGLVYHYFPDKDAVFAALVQEAVQQGIQLVAEARARPGSPWGQLEWLCTRMLEGIQREPTVPRMLVQAHVSESVPAAVAQALEPYSSRFFQEFVALIEAGQEAGEVVGTPAAELVWVCVATLQGLALMRIVPPARVPFPEPRTLLRLFAP